MFKKTKIAAVSAAVLGLSSMAAQATTATGVSLNVAGSEGQVLIFPYYNVNNSFITAFNITNTTNDYKALKIRFRESENSNDVLDFNVYLSPYDVFTMDLNSGSDGGVELTTSDNSCTHPSLEGGVLFRHGAYNSTSVEDVREGYLEVIEMGVINKDAWILDANDKVQMIASEGLLHEQPAGVPFDCGVIGKAWLQGVFVQGGAASNGADGGPTTKDYQTVNGFAAGYTVQNNLDSAAGFYGQASMTSVATNSAAFKGEALLPPMGGIVGSSILVDVANLAGFVTEPVSVKNYSTRAQHYISSDSNFYLLPSLASGSVLGASTVGRSNTYDTVARDWGMDDKNVLPRTSVPSGINPMPISDVMLAVTLGNQYFLGTGTSTDWVVSAPMRKHGIYNNFMYVAANTGYDEDTDIPVDGDLGDDIATLTHGYWAQLDGRDITSGLVYFNREEDQTIVEPGDFSPPKPIDIIEYTFDREVNILAFDNHSNGVVASVLGSVNAADVPIIDYTDGWGAFIFSKNAGYDLAEGRYTDDWMLGTAPTDAFGAPVHGFMAAKADLGAASVGETFPHFYSNVPFLTMP